MNTYLSLQITPQRYNIFHYDVPITEIFFKSTAHYTEIAPHSELIPLHICPVGTLPVAHSVVRQNMAHQFFSNNSRRTSSVPLPTWARRPLAKSSVAPDGISPMNNAADDSV